MSKKYDLNYENGRCPIGYEFVNAYKDKNGVWHDSYCRKIRKYWRDPYE